MIEQLAIFSENKPGRLERITDALAKAGVNLRAIHVASLGEMGVVKIVVDRPAAAFEALSEFGPVRKLPALAVRLPDRPGALHQVTAALSGAGINIENASGFAVSGQDAVLLGRLLHAPELEGILTADASLPED